MNKQIQFTDLGQIDYKEAWDLQEKIFRETVDIKIQNRKNSELNLPQIETQNHLFFCEHPHVYTLGKSGEKQNLLINQTQLQEKKATFYEINRGGDITYHGPGQIVGYPIFDLDNFFTDIHKYLRFLEEAVIKTLNHYNVNAGRIDGLTGVWLDFNNNLNARKICALGVKTSRWVTMHGFAFNINTDLSYFNNIIPCGITDKSVTSLSKELNTHININEVKEILKTNIIDLFQNGE